MSRLWRHTAGVGLFAVAAACVLASAASLGASDSALGSVGVQSVVRDPLHPTTGAVRVHGRIVFAGTATPARDLTITLTSANGFALAATTDDHGAFEFRDVPAAAFTLRLRKTGYVPVSTAIPSQQLKDVTNVDLGVIQLARAGVIAGRVIDVYGDPVVDMTVQAWSLSFPNPGERRLAPSIAGRTNDLGEYRLFGLMPGTYFVSAGFGRGFASMFYGGATVATDAQPIAVQPGEQALGIDVPVRQASLPGLSGIVVDASGHAGPDSSVILSTARLDGASAFTLRRVETDDEGRFRFPDLAPGDYQLDVIGLASMAAISTAGTADPAPGRIVPEFASVLVSVTDQTGDVSIRTTRGSVLRGRVTLDGQPPSGAALAALKVTTVPALLLGSQAEPDVTRVADVSDDGTFAMSGLTGARSIGVAGAENLILLRILLNGTDVTDDGVSFDRGDVEGLEVALTSRPAMVKGHVADANGRRMTGHVVVFATDERLRNRLRSRHVAYASAASDGTFTIGSLPPGQYLAIALEVLDQHQRGNPGLFESLGAHAVAFTLADGDTKTLSLVRR